MSQFAPVEFAGKVSAVFPTHRAVKQPRLWLPHVLLDKNYIIATGSALVVMDQRDINADPTKVAPLLFDLAENLGDGCSTDIFAPWVSKISGRLYFALAPSQCHPNELRIFSTYQPDRLKFYVNPPVPGTAAMLVNPQTTTQQQQSPTTTSSGGGSGNSENSGNKGSLSPHLRFEGYARVNLTKEVVQSTSHGTAVEPWVQFCVVFYQWNDPDKKNAASSSSSSNSVPSSSSSPWNLRCFPTPHTDPSAPLYSRVPLTPERVVANTFVSGGLQDLRGVIYWPALDALVLFGSNVARSEQNAHSAATNRKQRSTASDGGGCHLSVMWRNQTMTYFGIPPVGASRSTAVRESCLVLETAALVRDTDLLISAVLGNTVAAIMFTVNGTHRTPTVAYVTETSVPLDYTAVSATFSNRGVLVTAHCNKAAFWNWETIASSTVAQQRDPTTPAPATSSSSTTAAVTTQETSTTTTTTSTSLPETTTIVPATSTSAASTSAASIPATSNTTTSVSSMTTISTATTTMTTPAPSTSGGGGAISSLDLNAQCLISRFNYNTEEGLVHIVTQLLSDTDIPVTAVSFSSDDNSILAIMSRSELGLVIRRYLSWAIRSASPPLAEAQGGTPITIAGTGFARGDTMYCSFQPKGSLQSPTQLLQQQQRQQQQAATNGGSLPNNNNNDNNPFIVTSFVPATYINDRAIVCPAAAVTRVSGCSNEDTIDVSITESRFTGFGTSLVRFSLPIITSTTPPSVFANGASTLPITVVGTGFQQSTSSVARCKFSSNASGGIITRGEFVSSTQMRCFPPQRTLPLSPDSTVDVAVDSFKYTNSPVKVTIFGRPNGLSSITKSLRVADGDQYRLGAMKIIAVDASGNPTSEGLGLLPIVVRTVPKLCEPLGPSPCSPADIESVVNGSISKEVRLAGSTGGAMVDGAATFTGVELSSKTATGFNGTTENYFLIVAFVPGRVGSSWFATMRLYVDTGVPVALKIVQPPAGFVSDAGDMSATPSVSAVDVGDNVVVLGVEAFQAQADVLQEPAPPSLALLDPPTGLAKALPRFATFTNGVAEFLQVPVYARHGLTYRIKFSVRDNPQIRTITSGPILSFCPTGFFKLAGLYQCQTCLQHAVCDGANVSVNPGWWRASELSTLVVACPTAVACPGGPVAGQCAKNYHGPRCDLCEPGFGRGVTGTCDECPHIAVSAFFMILVIVCLTLLLALFTVYVVQNSDRPMPRVVVLQQLVTHMQTLAILTSLDNPWPAYLTKMAQWIDAVADFRVMDTTFGECITSAYGLDFTGKFFFQLVLMGEIFLCIATAKALLFLRPQLLKTDANPETDVQLIARGERRVPLAITTLRIVVPSALCGLFFLHQGTLMYAFGVLECFSVDSGNGRTEQVLLVDPSVSCEGSTNRGITHVAYPIIVILGLLVPVGLVVGYLAHRFFRPDERNLRYQLNAFLLCGVNAGSWYWPVLIFVRKGLMVLVVTILKWPFDAFFLQWIFVLYLVLLTYVRPYRDSHFQLIDAFSVVINILVINVGTLYHTADRSDTVRSAIAPVVIVMEVLATIGFSLLVSNTWRKWVFVRLGLEKPDLLREGADSVLQLHEILRESDFVHSDHPSGFGRGINHDEQALELLPIKSRAQPKLQSIGDISDGLRTSKKITPNFGEDFLNDVSDTGGGDGNRRRSSSPYEDNIRRIDELPSKKEEAMRLLAKRREQEEIELRLMRREGEEEEKTALAQRFNNDDNNNNNRRGGSTTTGNGAAAAATSNYSRSSSASDSHYKDPYRPVSPRTRRLRAGLAPAAAAAVPSSLAKHNPMFSNKNSLLTQIKSGMIAPSPAAAAASSPLSSTRRGDSTTYVPAPVPLPKSLDPREARQEILESKRAEFAKNAELERQKKIELVQLEMDVERGPKVICAGAISSSGEAAAVASSSTPTTGFAAYRAQKVEAELEAQRQEVREQFFGRSASPTSSSAADPSRSAAASWRGRFTPLDTSHV